jgi:hypothetical protein
LSDPSILHPQLVNKFKRNILRINEAKMLNDKDHNNGIIEKIVINQEKCFDNDWKYMKITLIIISIKTKCKKQVSSLEEDIQCLDETLTN